MEKSLKKVVKELYKAGDATIVNSLVVFRSFRVIEILKHIKRHYETQGNGYTLASEWPQIKKIIS